MNKSRVEAFSDGVIAIILTIMVLDFKIPHGDVGIHALVPLVPIFLCYVLSFVNIGIYWTNHHHVFQAVKQVNGRVLLANLHLLFWLSLVPFAMGWMGQNHFEAVPVAVYGIDLMMCGVAYFILTSVLIRSQDDDSRLQEALGSDLKGKLSVVFYLIAIPVSFFYPSIALGVYVFIAAMWIIPDRRIEKTIGR